MTGILLCFLLLSAFSRFFSPISSIYRRLFIIVDLSFLPLLIPANNEPSGCLQTFGDCREGQIPRCSAALQV